jgi:hypothetical protein
VAATLLALHPERQGFTVSQHSVQPLAIARKRASDTKSRTQCLDDFIYDQSSCTWRNIWCIRYQSARAWTRGPAQSFLDGKLMTVGSNSIAFPGHAFARL